MCLCNFDECLCGLGKVAVFPVKDAHITVGIAAVKCIQTYIVLFCSVAEEGVRIKAVDHKIQVSVLQKLS